MKQLIQSLKTGEVWLEDVPAPHVSAGHVLVQTTCSLISPGTERMLIDFGRGGYLAKARQQPDKVRQVLDKVRTDGLEATLQAVRAKLDEPLAMGYSNVGRVVAVGSGVNDLQPGDRVASNGRHAELVLVPRHLCAPIPEAVDDQSAAFTVLGAIALHGIRLLQPTLGETFAVFGLGLIGQLAVQILRAHGARVLGFDYNPRRVELAASFGATALDLSAGTDPVATALAATGQTGVDGVLVTAATSSDELMHQAAGMCRQRGRIVLTGVTGLHLQRDDFYKKELTFQVSCSYGPGRYDDRYERQGQDYPLGYVRWTEQRNFEAVLNLIAQGRLITDPLVSRRVAFPDAPEAYEAIGQRDVIGVVLDYPHAAAETNGKPLLERVVRHHPPRTGDDPAVLGVIGAGGFARQKILPALVRSRARLKWVCTSTGLSAATAAGKFGIEHSTTEANRVLEDPDVSAVVIATRHDSHASLVERALEAGKSVFVEKPLCLTVEQLERIQAASARASAEQILMVGYNRRFAPLVQQLRTGLAGRTAPLAMIYTCNAGQIPPDHWTQDGAQGGGRILGEACHFIDLLHYLAGESPIIEVAAAGCGANHAGDTGDTAAITLRFADGSLGQVNYFSNGARRFPKEQLEVFCEGSVLQLDNFRRLKCFGRRGRNRRTWSQDKGHAAQFAAFVEALRSGGPSPIPLESLVNTTRATLRAAGR